MDFFLFLSSILLLAISMCFTPGPNNALAMATGMDKGFRAALPFCLGAAAGANISLILLGIGLNSVFIRFPVVYEILRYLGAGYMLWLAWKISGLSLDMAKRTGKRETKNNQCAVETEKKSKEDKAREGIQPLSFIQAVLFQLVNVKVWITNVIVVSNYIGTGEGMWLRFWTAVALFSCLGCGAMCSWAAGGVFMGRFLSSDGMRRANYVFAAFLAFSVVLLFV